MIPTTFTTDEELVQLAQQGKLDAFAMLYERYLPGVFNRVRFKIPQQDVEDVTQEVFIAVMRSLPTFKGNSRFSTWLRTLTNRKIADYYRYQKPEHESDFQEIGERDEESAVGMGNHPEKPAVSEDDRILLNHAFMQLPESYREILLLRFSDGLQFDEIARAMGKSLEATKSLFRRALSALRNQMDDQDA